MGMLSYSQSINLINMEPMLSMLILTEMGWLDIVFAGGASSLVGWYQNYGGSLDWRLKLHRWELEEGELVDILEIGATHNGRVGDSSMELATFELMFEKLPSGLPLTSADANSLIDTLSVYLDNGSGKFEISSDTLVATTSSLTLNATGELTIAFYR